MKKLFLTLTLVLFVIAFGISQDLPSYVPTDGLVAYYPFNGNANDESGNGHHGTVIGATLSSDRDGNENGSYNFNDNKYISLPEIDSNIGKPNTSFSISVWFKFENYPESYGFDQIIIHSTDSSSHIIGRIGIIDGKVKIYHRSPIQNNEPSSTVEILDNNWHNIVYIVGRNYNKGVVYFDGLPVINYEYDTSVDFYSNQRTWEIGNVFQYSNGQPHVFLGSIDDIGIWNRALNEQEIQNLYTSSNGDILLNGVVSAENNQIRNVADPTHGKDAVTKDYLLEKIALLQDQIDALQSTSGSGSVTDQDGNSYPYLTYGDQVWTVKNAEMVTYSDGTPIPQVTDATEWTNLTTGAWCYYDNDPSKGKLYNWYAVTGIHDNDENTPNKELAPEGWHVPTDAEWTELENYLIANGYNYDGTTTGNKIAKAMSSTTGWNGSTTDGAPGNNQLENNSSGFNVFPKGLRNNNGDFVNSEGNDAVFWCYDNNSSSNPWGRDLDNNYILISRYDGYGKTNGFSVRFVRD